MSEHRFDRATVERWREVADRARSEWDTWRSVSERASPAANAAVLELKMLLARTVDKKIAEWAVTRWMITLEPIDDCVRAELLERRPWPSDASRHRGQLMPPSH